MAWTRKISGPALMLYPHPRVLRHSLVPLLPLPDLPANSKQLFRAYLLLQFPLNLGDQLLAPTVDLILSIEQRSPALASFGLDRLDLFLTGELLFESEGCHGRLAGFLDLPVELLNLALQPHFQVIGPGIQLVCLDLKKFHVAL